MLVLRQGDVAALLTMSDAIGAVEHGFRQLALGKVVMPQRVATPVVPHQGLHLSMPAYVEGDSQSGVPEPGALAVKLVTVYGENLARFGLPTIQGVLLLHDAASGRLLAMMDAEHLTAVRTGAASGVATKYLAASRGADANQVAIFGAGVQAGPQLEAMCAVRPIQKAMVVTRSGAKDAAFCARMSDKLGIEVIATRDAQMAVQQANIICTATNAPAPVFDGAWIRPGTHINAIGAYTARMRELDTTAVLCSRVYVDHHPAAQSEAGDLLIPIANGALAYDHVAGALGDLLIGRVAGRSNPDEITLFKSVGLAMQDAVTAAQVYQLALQRGLGEQVEL
jgi:ornithine cyclodeaminase/alanine dehydrogenase